MSSERNYRVWMRESQGQWEKIDFAYTEDEAHYNARVRQADNPFHMILVLREGEQPPPDKPFRPGPPEIIQL